MKEKTQREARGTKCGAASRTAPEASRTAPEAFSAAPEASRMGKAMEETSATRAHENAPDASDCPAHGLRAALWRFSCRIGLTLQFVICIFFLLLVHIAVSFGLIVALSKMGILARRGPFHPLLLVGLISIFLGIILSLGFSKVILDPFREAIRVVDELALGHFNVHIDIRGNREARELTKSLNHMAKELGGLEMLRSDFVDNFSHEFKTPIASIRGFAKMLQREDLTPEERAEYLDIIVSESDRLTELATNVLNLSKIENQAILSDVTTYNCSEQIRQVIVLLEPKWSKRNQELIFEGDEILVCGNAELLEQVWINLLDNAIKFSPDNTAIQLFLRKRPGYVLLSLTDSGPGIRREALEHIFDKFYQGDTSHATPGHGLGLAIVKQILELHGGSICVAETGPEGTTFEVMLPDGPDGG